MVWQLAWALHTYYLRRGRLSEQVAAWRPGLHAAEQIVPGVIAELERLRDNG